jgi:hypothetical protein
VCTNITSYLDGCSSFQKRGQPFAHVHIAVRVALINGHARIHKVCYIYLLADVQAMMPIKLGIRGKTARAPTSRT